MNDILSKNQKNTPFSLCHMLFTIKNRGMIDTSASFWHGGEKKQRAEAGALSRTLMTTDQSVEQLNW